MTDSILIDVDGNAALGDLRGAETRVRDRLRRALQRLSILVQGRVKAEKLSGQVLHVRTGTLRRSINRAIEESGSTLFATVGTNVVYGRVHEFGYTGPQNVRAHTRTLSTGGTANVRAFTRQVSFPPRSFLRSTLAEMADLIRGDLTAAAVGGARGGA